MKQVPKNSTTTSIFLLNIPSSSHLIAFLTFPLQDFKYIIMKNIPLKTKLFKEILISWKKKPISYMLLVLFLMWHISLMSAEAAYSLELNR